MENLSLDPERQKQARKYSSIQRLLSLLNMFVGGIYALAWLLFGWGIRFQGDLRLFTQNPFFLIALFSAGFSGVYLIISFPLDFYTSYILPYRFDLSNLTLKNWFTDQIKSLVIVIPLGLFLLELIYYLIRISPGYWWLWAAFITLIFSVVLTNLAPILIMPLFYKITPLAIDRADLVERLLRLAEKAGTQVKGVYKFDMSRRTKTANAALTGLGNTRRIILGDTLIEEFSPDEIETVLAHELGHHVHKDLPFGIITESFVILAGLYLASLALGAGTTQFQINSPADPASLPLLTIIIGIYEFIIMPALNSFSRWREQRADQFALDITGNGNAYATALTRLANQNLADANPEAWVEYIFYSHPALVKRITMAREYHLKNS